MTEQEQIRLLKQTLDAQDEREKEAGKRCGVPWEEWGCDWPDRMADVVIDLRNKIDELKNIIND